MRLLRLRLRRKCPPLNFVLACVVQPFLAVSFNRVSPELLLSVIKSALLEATSLFGVYLDSFGRSPWFPPGNSPSFAPPLSAASFSHLLMMQAWGWGASLRTKILPSPRRVLLRRSLPHYADAKFSAEKRRRQKIRPREA